MQKQDTGKPSDDKDPGDGKSVSLKPGGYSQSLFKKLKTLYEIHDSYSRKLDNACKTGCSDCCTRNVTMTTLEAGFILDQLDPSRTESMLDCFRKDAHHLRYRPGLTINHLAKMCMEDGEIPEEAIDPLWHPCPLLVHDICIIYPLRPLACRNMVSAVPCRQTGEAKMQEIFLSAANLFLQVVEHLDHGGYFGNICDVLLMMEKETNGSRGLFPDPPHLLKNRKAPVFLISPDHQKVLGDLIRKIAPLLQD